MRISTLAIQGFKSFAGDEVLTFPENSQGFFLLNGDNRVEELGSNGAGKSSVWDALVWCLYGKTARGGRGPGLINWTKRSLCSVMCDFTRHGRSYSVSRTQAPNTLNITEGEAEPRTISQDELDTIIGVNYDGFLHTALMGQFNQFFFDLAPSEKLKVFTEVLDLHVWQGCSKRAKARADTSELRYERLSKFIASLEGRLEEVQDSLKMTAKASALYQEAHDKEISQTTTELQGVKEAGEAACFADTLLSRKVKTLQRSNEADEVKVKKLDKEQGELGDAVDVYEEKIAIAERERGDAAGKLAKLVDKAGKTCGRCGQKITKQHVAGERSALQALDKALGLEVAAWRVERKEPLNKWNAVRDKGDRVVSNMEERDKEIRELNDDLRTAKREQQECESDYRELEGKLSILNSQQNPHDKEVERLTALKMRLASHLLRSGKALRTIKADRDCYRYWIKGFKDLQLWVVQEALNELSLRINNCLELLGLVGWSVHCDVERETSAGKISRGFTVLIQSPHAEDPTAWELWSGGETQRLRIAGSIGLSSLISSRCGFSPSIEVWDEPAAHLSEEGIVDMLDFFETRAAEEGRQIWLVDHHSFSSGNFDDTYTVMKDEYGSHITQ